MRLLFALCSRLDNAIVVHMLHRTCCSMSMCRSRWKERVGYARHGHFQSPRMNELKMVSKTKSYLKGTKEQQNENANICWTMYITININMLLISFVPIGVGSLALSNLSRLDSPKRTLHKTIFKPRMYLQCNDKLPHNEMTHSYYAYKIKVVNWFHMFFTSSFLLLNQITLLPIASNSTTSLSNLILFVNRQKKEDEGQGKQIQSIRIRRTKYLLGYRNLD